MLVNKSDFILYVYSPKFQMLKELRTQKFQEELKGQDFQEIRGSNVWRK